MEANRLMMEEMNKSWEQKLAEAEAKDKEEERKAAEEKEARESGRPQLLNLNEDGLLDRKIFLDLSKINAAKVGRKQKNPEENPEILLGGVGIASMHAQFMTDDNKTQVKPLSAEAMEKVFINGVKMTSMDPVTLKPNDRVIFGNSSVFLFRNQLRDSESGPIKDDPANPITYEMAMQEKLQYEEAE